MMDMELENIVANTVYIKAREGEHKRKGKSKKWKDMLRFAPLSQCEQTATEIEKTYSYIVERQPIGRRLFEDFCRQGEFYRNWMNFLELVNQYELSINDKHKIADEIRKKFLAQDAPCRLNSKRPGYFFIPGEEAGQPITEEYVEEAQIDTCIKEIEKLESEPLIRESKNKNYDDPLDQIFKPLQREIKNHLSDRPFNEFLRSKKYSRFVQWKELEKRSITKSHFRQYRVLGKGGFGEVCACQVRATGKLYACKRLEKKRIKKRHGEKMALNEKCILESINSRFVVTLGYAYETKDALHLVLTIMNGGDLKFHIHNLPDTMTFQRAIYYAAQIACGLEDLHAEGIIYRDLKPENCLLDDNGNIRISDLGLAERVKQDQRVKGRVGTVGYMAPEVVKNEKYGFGVDWWGLGCIIFELIAGRGPFRKRGEKVKRDEVEARVKNEKENYSKEFTKDYARELAEKKQKEKVSENGSAGANGCPKLATKLKLLEPLTIEEEENGRLAAKDICQKLLQKDPNQRLGVRNGYYSNAKEVQSHPFFATISMKHLKAGHYYPPFQPDQKAVYAKDVLDIEQFSTVKGVTIGEKDEDFYKKFNTGCVSITWQTEILETVFEELEKIPIEYGTKNSASSRDGASGAEQRSIFRRLALDCFSLRVRNPPPPMECQTT